MQSTLIKLVGLSVAVASILAVRAGALAQSSPQTHWCRSPSDSFVTATDDRVVCINTDSGYRLYQDIFDADNQKTASVELRAGDDGVNTLVVVTTTGSNQLFGESGVAFFLDPTPNPFLPRYIGDERLAPAYMPAVQYMVGELSKYANSN